MRDNRNGDAFFRRYIDCDGCPDTDRDYEYRTDESEAGEKIWIHTPTGIQYKTIERVYIDPRNARHVFPEVMINSFLREETFPVSKKICEEAGFTNVELKTPENEDDYLGGHRIMALVAQKPLKTEA